MAYWLGIGLPVRPTEFDSRCSLHGGRSDNASTFGLHPKSRSWILRASTKFMLLLSERLRSLPVKQIRPVRPWYSNPKCGHRPTGEGTRLLSERSQFESVWPYQLPAMVQMDRAQASEA